MTLAHRIGTNSLRALQTHATRQIPVLAAASPSLSGTMASASSPPRIAIVGGGPAGLTMGALLHKQRIPFTIFEFRPKPTEADLAIPSGMLDLHAGSGLDAIHESGVYDEFIKMTGECSQEYKVADKSGEPVFVHVGDGGRPEISRNNLYKLLLTKVPEENIRWDHKLVSSSHAAPNSSAAAELDFGNGRKHEFDLVVGADGAWSRVRHLLTDVRPHYTGTQVVTTTIRNITGKYPHLAELVGSGSYTALGNRQAVISQRGPMDSARLYLWLKSQDENYGVTSGLTSSPASAAKQTLLESSEFLGGFGPKVKELVATACDEEALDNPNAGLDIRPLYTLPHGSSWEHRAGITLVGDAAHLMLPNGEGVNQAMLDTMLLARLITQAYGASKDAQGFRDQMETGVREFEAEMFKRAVETGKETDHLLGVMYGSDNAAQEMLAFFQQGGARDGEEK
ncbi:hypothetical protein VHEMI07898 [[Torrubiella] hemipterigena]|uniref:FAD-binding domain-containing protein n=1 Tax=[Torrubiella] hemipterigena TaxID=1531966 RepID=A0A0A1TNS8_9HYPO|nr:hypothetical protein VHEMI07898 [[Torrubiella] hemipterigena]